jgi:hypothetical protein
VPLDVTVAHAAVEPVPEDAAFPIEVDTELTVPLVITVPLVAACEVEPFILTETGVDTEPTARAPADAEVRLDAEPFPEDDENEVVFTCDPAAVDTEEEVDGTEHVGHARTDVDNANRVIIRSDFIKVSKKVNLPQQKY